MPLTKIELDYINLLLLSKSKQKVGADGILKESKIKVRDAMDILQGYTVNEPVKNLIEETNTITSMLSDFKEL